jgi:hypothetical protein
MEAIIATCSYLFTIRRHVLKYSANCVQFYFLVLYIYTRNILKRLFGFFLVLLFLCSSSEEDEDDNWCGGSTGV